MEFFECDEFNISDIFFNSNHNIYIIKDQNQSQHEINGGHDKQIIFTGFFLLCLKNSFELSKNLKVSSVIYIFT